MEEPRLVFENKNGVLQKYRLPDSCISSLLPNPQQKPQKSSLGHVFKTSKEQDWILVVKRKNAKKAEKTYNQQIKETGLYHSRRAALIARPKRQKRAIDYFQSEYHKNKSTGQPFHEISSQGREVWTKMTTEEKQPYIKLSEIDAQRFREEQNVWSQNNRPRPVPPKTPYSLFMAEPKQPNNSTSWKKLSHEKKQLYRGKAEADKLRYEKELSEYEQWQNQVHRNILSEVQKQPATLPI